MRLTRLSGDGGVVDFLVIQAELDMIDTVALLRQTLTMNDMEQVSRRSQVDEPSRRSSDQETLSVSSTASNSSTLGVTDGPRRHRSSVAVPMHRGIGVGLSERASSDFSPAVDMKVYQYDGALVEVPEQGTAKSRQFSLSMKKVHHGGGAHDQEFFMV